MTSLNNKGVLFSFLAFLLVLSLLYFNDSLNFQRFRNAENNAFSFTLSSANSKFKNLYSDFALLNKQPAVIAIDTRNLPFSYYLDYNSITITQELPLRQNVWNNYFDLLNAFKIFSEDKNYSVFYDKLDVNVGTVKNTVWGGNAESLNFLLLPQCLRYSVSSSLSSTGFYPSNSLDCSVFFNPSRIKKYSIVVKVKKTSVEDYNSITYSIPGFSNPLNPEFEFLFIDSNCVKCNIADANKHLKGYFDPSQQGWIRIKCIGSNCNSTDINLSVNNGLQAFHSGNYRVDVNFFLAFNDFIDFFYFEDFNVSVSSSDFNLLYSNR